MMKNLGKVLMGLIMSLPLYAGLQVSVDSQRVTQGDSVVLSVRAQGDNVAPLRMASVCGEPISSTASGTTIRSINGNYTKEQTYTFTFTPTKDCVIAPITLKIDGVEEKSEPISIKLSHMVITKDSPFIIEMKSERTNVHVGEPFIVNIDVKMKHGAQAVDSKFLPPEMKNIWVKKEQQGDRYEEGDYTVTRLTYVMAAQKSGINTIGAANMKIATRSRNRDAWGQWMPSVKWRSYFSQSLDINASPLPDNVNVVGDLSINLGLDKRSVQANEAITATLTISGSGNFEDIGSLKPYVQNVSIFEEDPKITEIIEKGKYSGKWQQKFTLVSDGNYTIPSFKLQYFDTKTQSVKTLETEPVTITVKGGVKKSVKQEVKVERANVAHENEKELVASSQGFSIKDFGLGLLSGIVLSLLLLVVPWKKLKRKNSMPSLSDEKAIITLLMPYRDEVDVKEMIETLEKRVYSGSDVNLDKKALKTMVKKFYTLSQ